MTTRHERGAGPGSTHAGQTTSAFLQQIHHTALLHSAVAASDIATAVLSTLLLTLPRQEAQSYVSAAPPTLRDLLHTAAFERRETPEIVGREQVLRTIANRLGIDPEDAPRFARVVLAAAQNWLPRKELEHLKLQLAPELGDLWVPP